MNRKTGICIIAVLFLLFVFGVFYGRHRQKEEEQAPLPQAVTETETTIVASVPTVSYAYIVRAKEHRLVVYLGDGQTMYMETGIRTDTLEQEMQEKAAKGIGFTTQEHLFDFLESYSS